MDNTINVNAWVKLNNKNEIIPRNLGDDLNFLFLLRISDSKFKLYNKNKKYNYSYAYNYNKTTNNKNYLLIGSILKDKFIDDKTIIWGSGMLKYELLTKKPYKVCAVRGPKTRKVLLKSGIKCPEIYGDPALLLPYYYYPYILKKYKLGIIPHHTHINSELLNNFKNNKHIKIIDFTNYKNWANVIKDIVSCEFIVSEGLHGLILSDAYKIPNYYISFGDIDQKYKYKDYFISIGRSYYKPFEITNKTIYEDLLNLKSKYNNTFTLKLKNLVKACPFKLKNINLKNRIKPYTGKVLLCCIAKLENNYIREFVTHYKKLGFDNICLYDNNDPDGEHFEDVIKDYIDSGFVILKNVRGMKNALMLCYTKCYNEYRNSYDWIAFFDIDEFLHLDNKKTIKQFLANDKYNTRGINCIRVCWKQFDDNNIIKTNGDYSIKKFKTFLPITNKLTTQTKPIIKTVLPNTEFTSAHGPVKDKNVRCVNTAGELCDNKILIKNATWKNACLHHYRFKTLEEYVKNKMVRLWPTTYMKGGKAGLTLDFFFEYNKKTKEKLKYIRNVLKIKY